MTVLYSLKNIHISRLMTHFGASLKSGQTWTSYRITPVIPSLRRGVYADSSIIFGNSESISVLTENDRISDFGLCCMIHNEMGIWAANKV
jgi:hypothetical protein